MGLIIEEIKIAYNTENASEVDKSNEMIKEKKKEGYIVTSNRGKILRVVKMSKMKFL